MIAIRGGNMIKTTAILNDEYSSYANPGAKISRLVRDGVLIPIINGLYETDRGTPGHCFAGLIYGPSYLSFEYALSLYDLIPEAVYTYTSATCLKKKKKQYDTPFGTFTYRDVPVSAFSYGNILHEENGMLFFVASPEKAICDILYSRPPCANKKELRQLLFEDLRIDEGAFKNTDHAAMTELAQLYKNTNHRILVSLIKEIGRREQHDRTDAECT